MNQETGSLARIVDEINQSSFDGKTLNDSRRNEVAVEIASTVGKPGSYGGMFAPSDSDFEFGVRTFTGEPLRSRAGVGHVLGEEACRSLILLNAPHPAAKAALVQATHGMLQRLRLSEARGLLTGHILLRNLFCGLLETSRCRRSGQERRKDDGGYGSPQDASYWRRALEAFSIPLCSPRSERDGVRSGSGRDAVCSARLGAVDETPFLKRPVFRAKVHTLRANTGTVLVRPPARKLVPASRPPTPPGNLRAGRPTKR